MFGEYLKVIIDRWYDYGHDVIGSIELQVSETWVDVLSNFGRLLSLLSDPVDSGPRCKLYETI